MESRVVWRMPLEEARRRGDLPAEADPLQAANLMLDCWEGAAARSRLLRSPAAARGGDRGVVQDGSDLTAGGGRREAGLRTPNDAAPP